MRVLSSETTISTLELEDLHKFVWEGLCERCGAYKPLLVGKLISCPRVLRHPAQSHVKTCSDSSHFFRLINNDRFANLQLDSLFCCGKLG